MKVVIQRAREASVSIDSSVYSEISEGLLILLGIEPTDDVDDIDWLINKISNLRIFNDDKGIMNLSVLDVQGSILIVSQFTLHASTKKGNRPSYIKAARPEIAIPLYEEFIAKTSALGLNVATGKFGADMSVSLVNDGPVTIIIDSKQKE